MFSCLLKATILDIAGITTAAHPAGVLPVDGFSLLHILNQSVPLTTVLRPRGGELWIYDDALRIGDYKLITGGGTMQTNSGGCSLLGLGGHPVGLPRDAANLSNFCGPIAKCAEATSAADILICTECKCVSYSPQYNATASGAAKCMPCVFNVRTDPGEMINLAVRQNHPPCTEQRFFYHVILSKVRLFFSQAKLDDPVEVERLAMMTTRLLELEKTQHMPPMPRDDHQTACDAMVENGGFFGPWAANEELDVEELIRSEPFLLK